MPESILHIPELSIFTFFFLKTAIFVEFNCRILWNLIFTDE